MLLGALGASSGGAAVHGLGLTVVDGHVRGAAYDTSLAAIVVEIVERGGGTVHWRQPPPQWRAGARFADEPVVDALGRLLRGGSMTMIVGATGRVRQLIVLRVPPGETVDPPAGGEMHASIPGSGEAEPVDRPPDAIDNPFLVEEPPTPPLSAAEKRRREAERRRVVRLGRPGRDTDVAALMAVLERSLDDETKAFALAGLARIASPSAIAEIATLAQRAGDELLRSNAGKQLASLAERSPEAEAALAGLVESSGDRPEAGAVLLTK